MDFNFYERPADSPLVERIWYSHNELSTPFTSMAESHWGIVLTRSKGKNLMTIRGPETRVSPAVSPPDSEFVGLQFRPGAFMPNFPVIKMMDRQDVNLDTGSRTFWLQGSHWEIPDFENAEDFVRKLVREGLLLYDPLVDLVLDGQPVGMTMRTIQRRFLQATGLNLSMIYQIKRARYALSLLKEGRSILDTIEAAGYYDQAHLSKHLKRFTGQTPAQVVAQNSQNVLSLLYKTQPF
jgi:AraC-like DNA-binding protein